MSRLQKPAALHFTNKDLAPQCRYLSQKLSLLIKTAGKKKIRPALFVINIETFLAAAEPTISKGPFVCFLVIIISLHHIYTPDDDLSPFLLRQRITVLIMDRHLVGQNRSSNTRITIVSQPLSTLILPQIQRQETGIAGRLRPSTTVDNWHPKLLFKSYGHLSG